jgi:inner membrane protein
MNDTPISLPSLQAIFKTRSMGMKLVVVCASALVMTIPALFVGGLVEERTQRANDVTREIGSHVGGQQTFLGPTLAIPYTVPAQATGSTPEHGTYLVFPVQGGATVKTRTEERRRSLFKVPVFEANLQFDAAFDLTGVPLAAPLGAVLDWSQAELVVGVSDARGALADGTITANGKTDSLVPTDSIEGLSLYSNGNQNQRTPLTLFGVMVSKLAQPNAKFQVSTALRFSGAQRIAFLAYGKTTHLNIEGDWPNPSFDGGFLPIRRTVSTQGFSGEWSVPWIARGIPAEGRSSSVAGLDSTALGVSFVELADPYQSVNRSLKYVLLFLGLLFLSYFIFEVTTGKRVHPAQYILVGIAQIIFYLLLLSFAERIGFDFGFLLAGSATVILLSANAGWIFESRIQGLRALLCFGLLYALIYMLLRLEDNALLVGAIASFLAVAAAMYFTRGIDWYSQLAGWGTQEQQASLLVPKDPA